ncbi:MAG: DUF494 family protein [Pseudomonadota bacterium]
MKAYDFDVLMELIEDLLETNDINLPRSSVSYSEIVNSIHDAHETCYFERSLDHQLKINAKSRQSSILQSHRVYTHDEIDVIGGEKLSYLLHLEKLQIITDEIRENIIQQIFQDYNCDIDQAVFEKIILTNLSIHNYSFGLQAYSNMIKDNYIH